jgi:hypothetical protein
VTRVIGTRRWRLVVAVLGTINGLTAGGVEALSDRSRERRMCHALGICCIFIQNGKAHRPELACNIGYERSVMVATPFRA